MKININKPGSNKVALSTLKPLSAFKYNGDYYIRVSGTRDRECLRISGELYGQLVTFAGDSTLVEPVQAELFING